MSDPDKLFQEWQFHILHGNEAFSKTQWMMALSHYERAVMLAEELIKIAYDYRSAVMALVVSHQNTADLYLHQNEAKLAGSELECVHLKLQAYLDKKTTPPELAEALLGGLRRTYSALLLHRKNVETQSTSNMLQSPELEHQGSGFCIKNTYLN